jgi:TRAP-type C4-dicarboxylate transport system substrate-binding protein
MTNQRTSIRIVSAITLLALGAALVPGSSTVAKAADQMILKFAVMIPRTPELAIEEKKYNKRLAELTNNTVQTRVYWGGAAGGETDVLRKMRTGQIDGTPLSLDVLSAFVRECLVLQTPALFRNYKQVDSVRKELTPAFEEEAYKNGYQILVWGDIGRLRIFSKGEIKKVSDFKKIRPWLYPESEMLKEFYKQIGATGVPLDIAEVYGAMQTGMIDTFWGTAVLSAALQWHRTAKFMSREGLGFISGAVVFRRGAWDPLPDTAKKAFNSIIEERAAEGQKEIREMDDKTFDRLSKRGIKPIDAEDESEWWAAGKQLRRRLVGRIYTQQLVDKAEKIALQHADAEQLKYFGK